MRIRTEKRMAGPIPSEAVVVIPTIEGEEQLVVHSSQVDERGVEVGFIRERDDNTLLVELPRETMSGRWRVWVPKSAVAA
jgi:predicted methyltransferase MtxX (methanogen marker protein 4)